MYAKIVRYSDIEFIQEELTEMAQGDAPLDRTYAAALIRNLAHHLFQLASGTPDFDFTYEIVNTIFIRLELVLPLNIRRLQQIHIKLKPEGQDLRCTWAVHFTNKHLDTPFSLQATKSMPLKLLDDLLPVERDAETLLSRLLFHDPQFLQEILFHVKKIRTTHRGSQYFDTLSTGA